MKKSSQNKRPLSRGNRNSGEVVVRHPPMIQMSFQGTKTLRFIASGVHKDIITVKNLLDTLIIATSATTGNDIFESIRLKSVEMWAQSASSAVTLTLGFISNGVGGDAPTKIYSDTAMGPNEPAHLICRPPKNSSAGFWQSGFSTNQLFEINAVAATIIDVTFDYVLMTDSYVSAAANPLAGATAGILYARGLDGLGSGTSNYALAGGTYPPI